ncbi:MAG: hypothetical protein M3367_05775 [Acidobacteriota bacterium]|nr:hypothetical protein [Acidobacteriota bacterium]
MAKLVAAGGTLPALEEERDKSVRSPRQRGVQQGIILMFVSVLLLPLVDVIGRPYHEILILMFLLGGILRALYALAFQEGALHKSRKQKESVEPSQVGANVSGYALSPSQAATLNFNEQRVETAEMVKLPDTVTENTTKLLDEQNNPNLR